MTERFKPPTEPLTERNTFRHVEVAASQLPAWHEVRSRLPIPVLPEDSGWEHLYWSAWEALWSRLRRPAHESLLTNTFLEPRSGAMLDMGASCFVAQVSGYLPGPFRLIGILDNFYARQHDTGFICRALNPASGEDYHLPYDPNGAGPNLAAWTEWRHFRLTGDRDRVAAVFWPLLAFHRWCQANRTWPNGLYWTTGHASGLLNQPRVLGGRYHHNHWSWVDATAQAVLNQTMLERLASVLDEQDLAAQISAQRLALIRTFNSELWNDTLNFYQDAGPDGSFSSIKSIAAFWALLDSQLIPKERLTPFIQHLRDTWSFRTDHVLPSLSADDEAYNARTGNCYRGGVWPALTYMVLRGLNVAEQHLLAHKLATNHVDTVYQVHEATGLLWENYAPEELGPGQPSEEDTSGQTAAATICMLLEHVLGLSVDWPLRQVTWRRYLKREQAWGVRNLPLGNEATLDLLAANGKINVRTDVPVTLILHDESEVVRTAAPAGEFTIDLA